MMISRIATAFSRQGRITVTAACLAAVAVVGVIDFALGHEIAFSIFYLAPIAYVTWLSGRPFGFAFAGVSAVVWLVADTQSGFVFVSPLIPLWNAVVRLGFFIVVVDELARLKSAYDEQARISRELQDALDKVKVLSGLIPICAWCKKVRNDEGYWQQVETYISENSEASFTHGMCPECKEKQLQSLREKVT